MPGLIEEKTARAKIERLLDHPRVTFIEGSITDLDLLMETFPGADGIFHQAAIPSVPRSVKDPLASNEANVTGTLDVLVAAKDCRVPAVVAASSSSVYGDTPGGPGPWLAPLDVDGAVTGSGGGGSRRSKGAIVPRESLEKMG